jgi:hypothetical protein
MVYQSDSQQYLSVYAPIPPRSRQPSGLLGSIWAPQPQQSDTTWPRALESFSRAAELQSDLYPLCEPRIPTVQPIVSRDDVFGPVQETTREIGAIGDGRKKNSPGHDDAVCVPFQDQFDHTDQRSFFTPDSMLNNSFVHSILIPPLLLVTNPLL